MCLIRNKERERQLRQRLAKSRRITAYKALYIRNGFIESLWHPNLHRWAPGWNVSDRRSVNCQWGEVHHGIHVFLHRTHAEHESNCVLPVQCQRSDFVAAGQDLGAGLPSAVFMKVFVKKADWQAAEKCDA